MSSYLQYIKAPRPALAESLPVYVEDELDKIERSLTSTITGRKGSATLSSGSVAVPLNPNEPNDNYSVFVSSGVNETFYTTAKTESGFTINSSNGSSSAAISWLLVR